MRTDYSDVSFWLATYGPYQPNDPLQGDLKADVAIIGGGFTGMATAYYLKKAEPSLKIVVLESEVVGFGASGRNGSFAMTVIGLGIDVLAMLKGKQAALEGHRYMERAVDTLGELVEENNLACDYTRPGFLRMATTDGYVKKIKKQIELCHELGISGIEWLERDAARAQVHSDLYLGAWWEPRMALVNPAKLVREEKRVVQKLGVAVYEHTPVTSIERGADFTLKTPGGSVTAHKVVFATNAYSHLIPQIRRKQIPAWTYMIATEPLTDRQFDAIGWQHRQGVEDARNLIHYYRISPDHRLLMGGGPVGLSFGGDMNRDSSESAWKHLEEHIAYVFPALKRIKITHRWGGPFSVTVDLTPALGYLGDKRAVYSVGCIGHGVSMTHMNGQTIRDLILEKQTDLTDVFLVNRRVIPWPPEPLRLGISVALRAYLQAEDWAYERNMPRRIQSA
jgi:glycine/D-amino acid oxidase-like deaminating enzyme